MTCIRTPPTPGARRRFSSSAQRAPVARALAACLACALGTAQGADSSCGPLAKAVRAGMAQSRIHAVIDTPLNAAALKMGVKQVLLHSIVIDKVQHSNALDPAFRRVALETPSARDLATDLAAFEVEAGCKAEARERLAGRATQAWSFSIDLGRGEAHVKVWVDTATGLPVRALSDEPDVDVDVGFTKPGQAGAAGKLEVAQKPNGKRVIGTHAYLYGEAVRPPGAKGAIDPAALAQLQALLKGTP
ncbi:MAG: hypothetical protein JNN03_24205 [Rubrivivax sp.]|nr:hypothetical protein [Rubrivivax sp.]